MDEIGRGTSTYDGISIAWSVAEALVSQGRGPKTLFATHYHELQTLEHTFPKKVQNMHMAVAHHQDQLVFLYTLEKGGASHSYGLAVAQLAGVPESVISRAEKMLKHLERTSTQEVRKPAQNSKQMNTKVHQLSESLQTLSIETLTPLEALNILATWKKEITP